MINIYIYEAYPNPEVALYKSSIIINQTRKMSDGLFYFNFERLSYLLSTADLSIHIRAIKSYRILIAYLQLHRSNRLFLRHPTTSYPNHHLQSLQTP